MATVPTYATRSPAELAEIRKRKLGGLADSMVGQPAGGVYRAFEAPQTPVTQAPTAISSPTPQTLPQLKPSLPTNYGFGELANYEERRRTDFAKNITDSLSKRRAELSSSLNNQGKSLFESVRPELNEDLNSQGVYLSGTARDNSQNSALSKIALENQRYLNDFDTQATAATLQAEQDALDSALDLRRGGLEAQLGNAAADREEALARDLAKQSQKNGITNALIGGGASLLGGALQSGALKGLFGGGGGGGAATTTAAFAPTGQVVPGVGAAGAGSSVFGSGGALGSGLGGGLAIGGAGLGAMALSNAAEKKYGTLGGVLSNPIGYQLNKGKKLLSNPKQALRKAFGGGSHTDTKGSEAWMNGMDPNEIARLLGTQEGYGVSYDSNQAGSALANTERVIANFTPEQMVARYSSGPLSKFSSSAVDKKYKMLYDQAAQIVGRAPTPDEFASLLAQQEAV